MRRADILPWMHKAAGGERLRALALSALCGAFVLVGGVVQGGSLLRPAGSGALAPGYVGSSACAGCHGAQSAAWSSSQHARAMQAASDASVLGDFNDLEATHFDSRATFARKSGGFVIETEGRDGARAPFRVDYTFGVTPLQQYLTRLADGRLQALPYAWDARARADGGQRWFHVYPAEPVPPGDALHWTGAQQNWNFMCADCHSTGVRKNYDAAADTFATSVAELSVGCESCHGPGASHVLWAQQGAATSVPHKGFASVAAKRKAPDWTIDPATGSPAAGVGRPIGDEVETCGVCHARRAQFAEGWRPGRPLADFYRPSLLTPDLFEVDGQMKDEVFNYASFQQSRMHAKGVACGDCHDPHGGKLRAEGAGVCRQCHLAEKFAATAHTGHPQGEGQPDCIGCHMPARVYMGIDKRHDHSFRAPRPDLSARLGAPNACNDCHRDRPPEWAADAVVRWHGGTRKSQQTYAAAFHAARADQPQARALLMQAARDPATPALARATALTMLHGRLSVQVTALMIAGLADPDPMVRAAALGGLAGLPPAERWRRASPLLNDPVRLVRMEAANALAQGPPDGTSVVERQAFLAAAAEYVDAERFNADRAESRANLARFFLRQGRAAEAEAEYLAALRLSSSVAPRVDLADLYRATGRDAQAQKLLREAVALDPRAAAPRHALGLWFIRAKQYHEGLAALRQAFELEPGQARYAYVYAVALESMDRAGQARSVLEQALQASPSDTQALSWLLQDALRARDPARALPLAERLRTLLPDDHAAAATLAQVRAAAEAAARK